MKPHPNRFFAPGREFSLIESLFDPAHFSRDGKGLGDDAYLLSAGGETWAVSLDCSVENLHYRCDWAPPEAALEKAVLSNLSDINAVGGRASLLFLGLGALKAWDEDQIRKLGDVLKSLEARHGFRVAGGDTVAKDAESFFAVTVMGRVTGKPLLRSAAKSGDAIYVSGNLGASAAGLALLSKGLRAGSRADWDECIAAHLQPSPPLALGPLLAGLPGAGAAIDISDGLSSELWHLSRQSGCRLRVEWGKLPYADAVASAGREGFPEDAWRKWILHGGEDYQLLFTGVFSDAELAAIRRLAPVREIGSVAPGAGVGILDESGVEKELEAGGWNH